jgi:hypothetical protein
VTPKEHGASAGRVAALLVGTAAAGLSLALLSPAHTAHAASPDDERALAERFAPVVRLVEHEVECGPGEPYQPSDVDAFLDNQDVALRGPWQNDDLIEVGPTGEDLGEGRATYHLDFPGDPLNPRCDYETWAASVTEGTQPTVYAHVATEQGTRDRLALQYWFYYPFNDYNNKHESDWEMIQLVFAAADAAEALDQTPLEVGYSQHEGMETASWDDPKLELVDQTHPVVHPAAGSHANYYDAALFLGRSAQQGFGCDDTRSPASGLALELEVIPSEASAARTDFPWIGFEGRWGQREPAFYNAPTGPSAKEGWTAPISNQEAEGHDHSYAVPAGGLFGTQATDLFCNGVENGSDVVRVFTADPGPAFLVLLLLVVLVAYLIRRTTWRPTGPFRIGRRRAGGQIIAAAARAYMSRWRVFVGIGLLVVPVFLLMGAVQTVLVGAPDVVAVPEGGEGGGLRVLLAGLLSYVVAGLGMLAVFAAAARALVEIDAGRTTGVASAYRLTGARWRALLGAFAVSSLVIGLAGATVLLLPVALVLAVAWALYMPVIVVEGTSALGGLRRSAALVRRRAVKVAVLLATSVALAVALGPALGLLVLLATDAPFQVVNVIAGITFAFLSPYIALTMTYAYLDARISMELDDRSAPDVLPAELEPAPSAARVD